MRIEIHYTLIALTAQTTKIKVGKIRSA